MRKMHLHTLVFLFALMCVLVLTACGPRNNESEKGILEDCLNMSLREAVQNEPVYPPEPEGDVSELSVSLAGPCTPDGDLEIVTALAAVRIESWMGEYDNEYGPGTFFAATVLKTYKGDLPENIIVHQFGTTEKQLKHALRFMPGNEYLLFLRDGSDMLQDMYWVESEYVSVIDLVRDENGDIYYSPIFDNFALDFHIENRNGDAELCSRLLADLVRKDPRREKRIFTYLFSEADVVAWCKRMAGK